MTGILLGYFKGLYKKLESEGFSAGEEVRSRCILILAKQVLFS